MVNSVAIAQSLIIGLMKLAGIQAHAVDIEPGTVMNFWVPTETIQKKSSTTTTTKPKQNKPVVVLVHGFAANGIMTWSFQVGALAKKYSVYVPDLLFFGGSISDKRERSPELQAECLAKGLRKLGIERCVVVGFSYGGIVAFKMAQLYPDMVRALVVSGSVVAMTQSINELKLKSIGFSSFSEFLLPESLKGLKKLFAIGAYKKLPLPDRLYRDYLKVMFNNREEHDELIKGMIVSNEDLVIPHFLQRIHLLWGEKDQIFKMEDAYNMKRQLGEKATVEGIEGGGHLVHLERPCLYNKCLNKFLASLPLD